MTLTVGEAANGGSCVARHDGRVVFVRYALPGETVRVRITSERGSYWHADAVEIVEPAADRVDSLCPIAGVDGAGCCDQAFVEPGALRRIKAEVVANQLQRLGGYDWQGQALAVGESAPTGWRTRVRLEVGGDGRAGFHRYHSSELVTDLRCAQLPPDLLAELPEDGFRTGDQVHVVRDDDGVRHVVCSGQKRRTRVIEGEYEAVQRAGGHTWRLPVTAFWQSHRDAPAAYCELVGQWAALEPGGTAWDLYGGAGLFAATMGAAVGENGRVISVDTSRAAARAGRAALADLPQVQLVTDSVRRALSTGGAAASGAADVAVLDPPRAGAGREIIDLVAAAKVQRVIHVGCETAAFARDIGLYRKHGYQVQDIRVYDAFPLTHHIECVALLVQAG